MRVTTDVDAAAASIPPRDGRGPSVPGNGPSRGGGRIDMLNLTGDRHRRGGQRPRPCPRPLAGSPDVGIGGSDADDPVAGIVPRSRPEVRPLKPESWK